MTQQIAAAKLQELRSHGKIELFDPQGKPTPSRRRRLPLRQRRRAQRPRPRLQRRGRACCSGPAGRGRRADARAGDGTRSDATLVRSAYPAAMPETVSPLAPERSPELPPIAGVKLGTAHCGIRYKGRSDLMVAVLDPATTIAGVFTRSLMPGAPVDWCRASSAPRQGAGDRRQLRRRQCLHRPQRQERRRSDREGNRASSSAARPARSTSRPPA